MPKVKFKYKDQIEEEDITTPEQFSRLKKLVDAGNIELLSDDGKPLPNFKDKAITVENPNAIKYPDMGDPSSNKIARDVLGRGYNALTGTMTGGPIGGVMGALTSPPNTYSEALTNPIGSKLAGMGSQALSNVGAIQSPAKQFLTQGAFTGGSQVAQGGINSFLEKLFDPNQSVKDTKLMPQSPEEVALMGAFGLMGGGLGAYSQKVKQNIQNSPSMHGSNLYNEMTGSKEEPYDIAKKIKEIQSGDLPNAQTGIAPMREKEINLQKRLQEQLVQQKKMSVAENSNRIDSKNLEEQATRLNKMKIAENEVDNRLFVSPQRRQIEKDLADTEERISQKLKKIDPNNPQQVQEVEQLRSQKFAQQQYLTQMRDQSRSLAAENIMRKGEHIDLPENRMSFDENSKAFEASKEMDQHKIKILQLQKEQREGKFGIETTNILKGLKNSEELPSRLLESDVPTIRKFMAQTQDIPNMKQSILNEVMQQSWDGKSFSNFSKLYGTQGERDNIRPKLAALLGDKDQADRALEFVDKMNESILKASQLGKKQSALANIASRTLVIAGVKGKALSPESLGTTLGENVALHALNMPQVAEDIIKNKDKFERWKKWMESGWNSEFLKKGDPLMQDLLGMSDEYKYGDDGQPIYVGKKRK